MTWIKTTDALPPFTDDWLRRTTATVLVTDGKEIAHAYAVKNFEEEDVQWYQVGTNFWLTFTPTRWQMLPVLP
jgi:hypothetical protein